MNIVACIKRVPATETQPKVAADGMGLDHSALEYMLSFYDEIALEEAIRSKEAHGGEVTALTLGPTEASKELRDCLARGADKGRVSLDPACHPREPRTTPTPTAATDTARGAELVFCGRQATDRDNAAVGPMLATMLGWSCVTDVIELHIDGTSATAKRESERGIEHFRFTLPAVITCQKGLNEPRYAGLKGIMAAKKKPIEEAEPMLVESATEVVGVSLPPARPAGRIVGEGPDAVPALLEALRTEAKVL
ncbi:MAG: electron transfer flavoprotein subunit beta/FixA family protein [Planctomycetota bacterium]|nr:electron transfer flavoprotein subunit beta/FixA family protein [Planctomycetota bacterium]